MCFWKGSIWNFGEVKAGIINKVHTLHIGMYSSEIRRLCFIELTRAICFKICHVLYEKWKPQSCKFEACISKGYFIKHKTLISEKWKPGNPINVWNCYHTPKIFFWWIQLFYIRIDCGFSGSLSICNMHFHVEFHSPHTDKVQQNWILNMKGVREILSPSLDAIAAAFQTNYSALILQIPVWWPVQCTYFTGPSLWKSWGVWA